MLSLVMAVGLSIPSGTVSCSITNRSETVQLSMKIRDSGMPDEDLWSEFFDPVETLQRLGFQHPHDDVLDMGCGYGTFSVAAAQLTKGVIHALDIEPNMISATLANARGRGLHNVIAVQRDFVIEGTGLSDGSVGYAMLLNILHAENPESLLREAYRVLRVGGTVAVTHWIDDERTPRGPPLSIRPRPEQCVGWLHAAGFKSVSPHIDLPPFHYGLFALKAS
jgi:SAM-dependent methyltransferase